MRILTCLFISLIAFCALASSLPAQTVTATLVGRVSDQSGAVLPGVTVTARNVDTNIARTTISNDEGNYKITALPPGRYEISAELAGFRREMRSGVILQITQEARIDFALTVGEISQTISVTGEAPLLQSENSTIGNVVDQAKIQQLPLNGRDYIQLAFLQPNVMLPAQGSTLGFRGGFNVAGNSEVANNFILDGVDNTDETTAQPNHRPSIDAIREFRVLTGTYNAEYGRFAGGQVIVTTRSGTNEFHGSAFEFHRNDELDARNFFSPAKPEFKRNQFGGVFGGPIVKNKTFFFASYEGLRAGKQVAAEGIVPSLKMRSGDFSELLTNFTDFGRSSAVRLSNPVTRQPYPDNQIPASDFSTIGKTLLDLYPKPNFGINRVRSSFSAPANIDGFSVRVDHNFTERTTLSGSYFFDDRAEFFPIANPLCGSRVIPGYGCDELQRTQVASISLTHVFNPRLINESRLGYNRFGFFRLHEDRNVDVLPRLGIPGTDAGKTPFNNGAPTLSETGIATLGGPTNLPQGRHDNTYHVVENLTWIHGSHTLKFGGDIRYFLFNSFFTQTGRGQFTFNGQYSGFSVADLLLGYPSRSDRAPGEPFHNAISFSSGYFLQDDWKISPRLTLNIGLRYEFNLPPWERVNKIATFNPATNTILVAGNREAFIDASGKLAIRQGGGLGKRVWETDKNNFAPRFGFAWRPSGQGMVIRAGYGIFYNLQIVGNGITPLSRGLPFRLRQLFLNPTSASGGPQFNIANPFPDALAGGSLSPAGIQRDFATTYIQQWSLNIQRELTRDLVFDIGYIGSKGTHLSNLVNMNQALPGAGSVASRRPFKGWSDVNMRTSGAYSTYHGMQLRVEKRMSKGLSLLVSYTVSKSLDSNPGVSTGSDAYSGVAQDARNLRAEYGLSDFDVRQRFVHTFLYELPVGRGKKFGTSWSGPLDAMLGGWEINGILTLQTGRPFTPFFSSTVDRSLTGGFADRPNLVGDPKLNDPTPDRWFNTAALALPPLGSFGNAGRNIVEGPGLKNFDFGLFKKFRFTESKSLQFRTEFFNLTNHPNFALPNGNINSGSFGRIENAADGNSLGAQRQIQFGLKFLF